MVNAEYISNQLGGHRTGDGYMVVCPSHHDETPSLSVTDKDGKILVYCHAGCDQVSVIKGLKDKGLWHGKENMPRTDKRVPKQTPKKSHKIVQQHLEQLKKDGYKYIGNYRYADVSGKLMYYRIRMDHPTKGKWIRPISENNEGELILKEPDFPDGKPLYQLPKIKENPDSIVWVVEGEKCADSLVKIGGLAVTSGASSSAATADWKPLQGRKIVIWPDNDKAGLKYGKEVAKRLSPLGCDVCQIDISKLSLPDGGDLVDWLEVNPGAKINDVEKLPRTSGKTPTFKTTRMSDVRPEKISWLWSDRIPLGKLSLLSGDPGLGKSLISLYMASNVSKGGKWIEGSNCPQGNVILLNAEDDKADTILPRLEAAGADLQKIVTLDSVIRTNHSGDQNYQDFLLKDVEQLEDAIKGTGDVKLVVIDPISAYMGTTDSHKNADVRGLLAPLTKLAATHRFALLVVSHLNKSQGGPAIYRTMGSLGLPAASRVAWVVVKDRDDETRRKLLPAKNNLAKDIGGLAYTIKSKDVLIDGETFSSLAYLDWESNPIYEDVNDALVPDEEKSAIDEAVEFLQVELADGPVSSKEMQSRANNAGHSRTTLKRAKKEAGVISERVDKTWQFQLDPDAKGTKGTNNPRVNSLTPLTPLTSLDQEDQVERVRTKV